MVWGTAMHFSTACSCFSEARREERMDDLNTCFSLPREMELRLLEELVRVA